MATTSSSAETVLHLRTLGVLEEFTKTSKFGLFLRSALKTDVSSDCKRICSFLV